MARPRRIPGLPRRPYMPGMPRRLKRADSLLVLLVLVVALLISNYCGGGLGAPLSPGQEKTPVLSDGTAEEQALAEDEEEEYPEAGAPVRFLMHNVANYFVAGEQQRSRYTIRPKPEKAREAVVDIIAHTRPEIVGLIEMGGPVALADLRQRLAARGLEYPYFRILIRGGEDRALAILSRHPIVQDNCRANVKLYGEQRRHMLRGILDVTVRLEDGRRFRIIGAHLKSRVSDDPAAADALRAREAHTLAMHIQQAIRRQPDMPLIVYGDWNDGPADRSLRVLKQGLSADAALTRLSLTDSRGEGWTLYYEAGKQYCTFDQLYVNKVLRKRMRRQKSEGGIIDIPAASSASDHRALWCELR